MDDRYKELACAVVFQAFDDLKEYAITKDKHKRRYMDEAKESAKRFLFSRELDNFITTYELDLNPDFLRSQARRLEC